MNLNQDVVDRYSRQLILSEVSLTGQNKLASAKIVIVGAGGLGCPSSLYCCAAGVGVIGLVDGDTVELSNLHRQVAHDTSVIGQLKVDSLAKKLSSLNPSIKIIKFPVKLDRSNAIDILSQFDIVLDCSDNAPTRYLISDTCVVLKKTLVSSSALRFEGQLSVFKAYESNHPCYRCVYPVAPDTSLTGNCSSVGVMGFVCGVMGSLQAQETIKQILQAEASLVQKMLIYDGLHCTFRTISLREKNKNCPCSQFPTSLDAFDSVEEGPCKPVQLLPVEERLTVEKYREIVLEAVPHLLLDVRNANELLFSCFIPPKPSSLLNVPLKKLQDSTSCNEAIQNITSELSNLKSSNLIVVLCKRGNDSQKAIVRLKEVGLDKNYILKDVNGGLFALKDQIPNTSIFTY